MHRYDPARRKLALGLAFLAGTVDATGFIRTGGYFASFMSGNTTRLGLHIAGQPSIAYIPFALICGFVTGVVLGSLLAASGALWLSFFPPAGYLAWVRGGERAERRAA